MFYASICCKPCCVPSLIVVRFVSTCAMLPSERCCLGLPPLLALCQFSPKLTLFLSSSSSPSFFLYHRPQCLARSQRSQRSKRLSSSDQLSGRVSSHLALHTSSRRSTTRSFTSLISPESKLNTTSSLFRFWVLVRGTQHNQQDKTAPWCRGRSLLRLPASPFSFPPPTCCIPSCATLLLPPCWRTRSCPV